MTQGDASQLQGLLNKGERLLRTGQARAAQECALEALALRPGNSEAKNLMGLSYYCEGAYGLACDIFDGLARQGGDVVALRINAGVAALRCQRTALALFHLRRAVDLDHSHRRAYGYLAILHLQGGDSRFASAAAKEAGLDELSERLTDEGEDAEKLVAELWTATEKLSLQQVEMTDGSAERFAQVDAPLVPAEEESENRVGASGRPEDDGRGPSSSAQSADQEPRSSRRPVRPPQRGGPPLGRETGLVQERGEVRIDSLTPAVAIGPAVECSAGRLYLRCGAWRSDRFGQRALVMREEMLLMAQGNLVFDGASRRTKGSAAGAFALPSGRMAVLDGEGVAVLECAAGRKFAPVTLLEEGDCLCVREDSLAAFSSALHWANGRLPDGTPIVRFAGQGPVVLQRAGDLGRAPIDVGTPAVVRTHALVGWLGDVWVSSESAGGLGEGGFVRCEGEGTLLLQTSSE